MARDLRAVAVHVDVAIRRRVATGVVEQAADVILHRQGDGAVAVAPPARDRRVGGVDVERYPGLFIHRGARKWRRRDVALLKLEIGVTTHTGDVRTCCNTRTGQRRQLANEGFPGITFRNPAAVEKNLRIRR